MLGWHIAELQHMGPGPGPAARPAGTLPQIGNLDFAERLSLLVEQVATGLAALPVETPDALRQIASKVAGGTAAPADLQQMDIVHRLLLTGLTGKDYRLGKAYALGVGLAETVLLGYRELSQPSPSREFLDELFGADRIGQVAGQLRDLKSVLADHAADATIATLLDWSETRSTWIRLAHGEVPPGAGVATAPGEQRSLARRLYEQGMIWRALLSGEKDARDYLQVLDYARSVGRLAGHFGELGRKLFLSPGILLAMSVAAIVVVLVAILMAGVLHADLQALWTALVGLLGVLGVTGVGVTTGVRQALANTESVLWDSELSAAIAEAVDRVPVAPADSNVGALRGRDPAHDRLAPGRSKLRPK